MSPGQLVQLLQAFAAVQHYNQAICAAAAQHAAQLIKLQGFRLLQPAAASTQATKQQHPQQQQQQPQEGSGFTGDQLISLLQALGSLRHHDPPLLEAACTCVLRSPQRSLSHVVALTHTCALLNHFHEPLFHTAVMMAQQAMQQQQQQQQQQEEGGSDRDLANVLAQLSWACGVMDYRADGTFLQQLSAWTAQLDVQQLSAQELRLWHEVRLLLLLLLDWLVSTCLPGCNALVSSRPLTVWLPFPSTPAACTDGRPSHCLGRETLCFAT
jgi:hypothetical protein